MNACWSWNPRSMNPMLLKEMVQLNFYMSDEDIQEFSLIKTEIKNYIEQNWQPSLQGSRMDSRGSA